MPTLRAVSPDERVESLPTLMEAVASGDILAIMKAQRRIIAEALVSAADNTRPQYSNELNKLNALIASVRVSRFKLLELLRGAPVLSACRRRSRRRAAHS